MEVLVTAVRPEDVAREVETRLRSGAVERFVLRAVAHGGMRDQERLGAARYAAARQADVRLEVDEPASIAPRSR
jgi:hypothetical protein